MNKNKFLKFSVVFLLFLTFACRKEEQKGCIEEYLEQAGMVEYQGEDLGCRFFVNLYEYADKQYFVLDNYCIDMVAYPTDCEGEKLCEDGGNQTCMDFFQNAVFVEIVGVGQ